MPYSHYPVLVTTALLNLTHLSAQQTQTAALPAEKASSLLQQATPEQPAWLLFAGLQAPRGKFVVDSAMSLQGVRVEQNSTALLLESPQQHQLQLGSGGIDLSKATADLQLDCPLRTTSDQLWQVAEGRRLLLGSKQNARVLGEHVISIRGAGCVDVLQGNFADFKGKWIVEKGATLRGIGNGDAWGSNKQPDSITLQGGTLLFGGADGSGAEGNWMWNNAIFLQQGSNSTLGVRLPSSWYNPTRHAILWGSLSGKGDLTLANLSPKGVMSDDNYGIILGGNNTFSGKLHIAKDTFVRLGVDRQGRAFAGNNGSLDKSVAIFNEGVLRLSRNDSWEFANALDGSGELKIGCSQGDSSRQVVTLLGHKHYSGNTSLQAGRLRLGHGTKLYASPAANARLLVENSATLEIDDFSAEGQLGQLSLAAKAKYFNAANIIFTTGHSATHNFSVGEKGANLSFNLSGLALKLNGNEHSDIELAGALHFDTNSSIEVNENIIGKGDISKSGSGTLLLRGNNSNGGNLDLQQGQLILAGKNNAQSLHIAKNTLLQLEQQAQLGQQPAIHNLGQLFCNQQAELLLGEKLKGDGLIVLGEGSLKLGDCKDFSGALQARKGTLRLAGEFGCSSLELGSEAQLRGDGVIKGDCKALGSIKPGDEQNFGKLRFGGELKIDAGAQVVLRLKSEQGNFVYDSMRSEKAVELGGLIIVNLQGECSRKPQVLRLIRAPKITAPNFDVDTQLLLPPPPPGMVWNTKIFHRSGAVALVSQHSSEKTDFDEIDTHTLINTTNPQPEQPTLP